MLAKVTGCWQVGKPGRQGAGRPPGAVVNCSAAVRGSQLGTATGSPPVDPSAATSSWLTQLSTWSICGQCPNLDISPNGLGNCGRIGNAPLSEATLRRRLAETSPNSPPLPSTLHRQWPIIPRMSRVWHSTRIAFSDSSTVRSPADDSQSADCRVAGCGTGRRGARGLFT